MYQNIPCSYLEALVRWKRISQGSNVLSKENFQQQASQISPRSKLHCLYPLCKLLEATGNYQNNVLEAIEDIQKINKYTKLKQCPLLVEPLLDCFCMAIKALLLLQQRDFWSFVVEEYTVAFGQAKEFKSDGQPGNISKQNSMKEINQLNLTLITSVMEGLQEPYLWLQRKFMSIKPIMLSIVLDCMEALSPFLQEYDEPASALTIYSKYLYVGSRAKSPQNFSNLVGVHAQKNFEPQISKIPYVLRIHKAFTWTFFTFIVCPDKNLNISHVKIILEGCMYVTIFGEIQEDVHQVYNEYLHPILKQRYKQIEQLSDPQEKMEKQYWRSQIKGLGRNGYIQACLHSHKFQHKLRIHLTNMCEQALIFLESNISALPQNIWNIMGLLATGNYVIQWWLCHFNQTVNQPKQLNKKLNSKNLGEKRPFRGKEYMYDFMDQLIPLMWNLLQLDQLIQKWISSIRMYYIVQFNDSVSTFQKQEQALQSNIVAAIKSPQTIKEEHLMEIQKLQKMQSQITELLCSIKLLLDPIVQQAQLGQVYNKRVGPSRRGSKPDLSPNQINHSSSFALSNQNQNLNQDADPDDTDALYSDLISLMGLRNHLQSSVMVYQQRKGILPQNLVPDFQQLVQQSQYMQILLRIIDQPMLEIFKVETFYQSTPVLVITQLKKFVEMWQGCLEQAIYQRDGKQLSTNYPTPKVQKVHVVEPTNKSDSVIGLFIQILKYFSGVLYFFQEHTVSQEQQTQQGLAVLPISDNENEDENQNNPSQSQDELYQVYSKHADLLLGYLQRLFNELAVAISKITVNYVLQENDSYAKFQGQLAIQKILEKLSEKNAITIKGIKMVLVWEFIPFILRHYLQKSCRLITHGKLGGPKPSPNFVCGQLERIISIILQQKQLNKDFNLHMIVWEALQLESPYIPYNELSRLPVEARQFLQNQAQSHGAARKIVDWYLQNLIVDNSHLLVYCPYAQGFLQANLSSSSNSNEQAQQSLSYYIVEKAVLPLFETFGPNIFQLFFVKIEEIQMRFLTNLWTLTQRHQNLLTKLWELACKEEIMDTSWNFTAFKNLYKKFCDDTSRLELDTGMKAVCVISKGSIWLKFMAKLILKYYQEQLGTTLVQFDELVNDQEEWNSNTYNSPSYDRGSYDNDNDNNNDLYIQQGQSSQLKKEPRVEINNLILALLAQSKATNINDMNMKGQFSDVPTMQLMLIITVLLVLNCHESLPQSGMSKANVQRQALQSNVQSLAEVAILLCLLISFTKSFNQQQNKQGGNFYSEQVALSSMIFANDVKSIPPQQKREFDQHLSKFLSLCRYGFGSQVKNGSEGVIYHKWRTIEQSMKIRGVDQKLLDILNW